jgi:hypothetical protein
VPAKTLGFRSLRSVELHFGIAGARRKDDAAKRARAFVQDECAGRHVIGKGVVDNVAGARASRKKCARSLPVVEAVGFGFPDRTR